MLHGLHAWAGGEDAEYMADISAGAVIAEVCGRMFDTSFGTEYPLAVVIPATFLDIALRVIASRLVDI
jgi:hypothetical protein